MKKIKNFENEIFEIDVKDIQKTNRLFLELLYNLSKYPRSELPKRYVRAGLLSFEEQFVLIMKKNKK